ncbi:Regulatory-associated protein of mTOR-like protein [Dinothrombium tinctorium]|uniref:Regulatory-associated protein of mTOR-like protein n=1 Tax=Dinothrombium tinctorium TaxID=1965070 RepID=A0A3S3Q0Y0_9ACAR|nr:Regulatory-associated protein of mTOR-like protein [Dinothrombium tinctorium]RWS11827.1 Regulatory-associated protein of mTOR-like protein [Dinothrombium tinctorium]
MTNNLLQYELDSEEDVMALPDWRLKRAFCEARHREKIDGSMCVEQSWRMKERMKTVSVALVMCLNLGVDPPDIVKTQPCAKLECWIDPATMAPPKALEAIGASLQKQYERWQPRARYKTSLDPTVEEVKRLCISLRRNAKDERVLFHYNGHGVPKPTVNGEIWAFNRSYTQYIPLSIYDLQQWMGAPSIYVYDCSCAGQIIESFNEVALQHEREFELAVKNQNNQGMYNANPLTPPMYRHCIQLAACAADQILPMNPDLPADLFTSCLTTPIKIALRWFIAQNSKKLLPGVTLDILEKIPGQLTDRRTMLGELNWIFTAITDTIAWNVLPHDLFQRLFRQDLLVASLFRNFLLSDRIMRSYNCTPVSSPRLPPTYHHPMWQAWDLAVDICLSQLPDLFEEDNQVQYRHSPFFSEQLTAFQVWLALRSRDNNIPEQLPIVLQVLLSQVHRLRALDLLGRFLDLGPWAVNLALSVGIFPYVLKLLQSSARELRPLLVFIWAKILAVDISCQTDLVRENGHKYFLNVLADPFVPSEHRTMAAFVMACIVLNHPAGQESAMQGSLIAICLEQLNDPNPLLRKWLAICLGLTWNNYEDARWCGVRDTAHDKLAPLLQDPVTEVRTAAVYALGTFINSASERTDHANTIDHSIGITLITAVANDGSPLVRKELIVALQWLVLLFENQFIHVAYQTLEEEKTKDGNRLSPYQYDNTLHVGTPPPNVGLGLRKVGSRDRLLKLISSPAPPNAHYSMVNYANEALTPPSSSTMKRVSSSTSLTGFNTSSLGIYGIANFYVTIWKALNNLANDPHPDVANMAQTVVDEIKSKIVPLNSFNDSLKESRSDPSLSEPSSPMMNQLTTFVMSESPPANGAEQTSQKNAASSTNRERQQSEGSSRNINTSNYPQSQISYFTPYSRKRKIFGREPNVVITEDGTVEDSTSPRSPLVSTDFVAWSAKYFSEPIVPLSIDSDTESSAHHEREWRTIRNVYMRNLAKEELCRLDASRIEEQIFLQKSPNQPLLTVFHPYDPHLIVAGRETFSFWLWDAQTPIGYPSRLTPPTLLGVYGNLNSPPTKITSLELVNAHDETLLLLACDDGTVRVWNIHGIEDGYPQLVTAFVIFNDLPLKSPGVVTHWNQETCQLIAGGDPKLLRIWDSTTEMRVRDIVTGCDSFVTHISTDGGHLICAGCQDGSIRIFDQRIVNTDCRVITFREHSSAIVNTYLFPDNEKHINVISGSCAGDVRFWDKRLTSSVKTINIAQGIDAMTVHPEADVFACGTTSHTINIYTLDGIPGSIIRYHDGFMGQRIGQISSLSFHPFRAYLAAGYYDHHISVYSSLKLY